MTSAVDIERRFAGLARLYGVQGARRIRRAHVAVVGVGGVGSWAAEALARSGVGTLTLIDLDHVAESNVNRQVHALSSTLGMSKVRAMAERIGLIHPDAVVHCVEEFVEPDNWPGLLPHRVDAVIDACDQLNAKTAMAAWAMHAPALFLCVGAAGGKQWAERVEIADLSAVTHDPLLSKLRYRLRREHGAVRGTAPMGITCAFSREPVAGPDVSCDTGPGDRTLNCHGYGSTVTVTATFGLCAAGRVLQQLASHPGSAA